MQKAALCLLLMQVIIILFWILGGFTLFGFSDTWPLMPWSNNFGAILLVLSLVDLLLFIVAFRSDEVG